MTAQERADKIFAWKLAIVRGDVGEAALIRRELEKEPLVPNLKTGEEVPASAGTAEAQPAPKKETPEASATPDSKQAKTDKAETPAKPAKVGKPVKLAKPEEVIQWPKGEFTVKQLVEGGAKQPAIGQAVAQALQANILLVVREESHGRGRPTRILQMA